MVHWSSTLRTTRLEVLRTCDPRSVTVKPEPLAPDPRSTCCALASLVECEPGALPSRMVSRQPYRHGALLAVEQTAGLGLATQQPQSSSQEPSDPLLAAAVTPPHLPLLPLGICHPSGAQMSGCALAVLLLRSCSYREGPELTHFHPL